MKKIQLVFLSVLILTVIGCNTTKGVGEDIERTGENIQEGIEDATR